MGLTVALDEDRGVRLTEEVIETRPGGRVSFVAEGVITVGEALLGEFAGTSLKPVRVDLSVDDSETVQIDLEEDASLRLESIDVGVETPDMDDLTPGSHTAPSPLGDDAESSGARPGSIAFTVEGAIHDVPEEALTALSDGSPTLEAITFGVEDPIRGDGGADDVLVEFALLGYGIAIHRDGTIDVGVRGGLTDVEFP